MSFSGTRSWWRNVWIRAGLLHPVGLVAPSVAACLVLAGGPASDVNDVAWGFWAVPLGAVASFVLTCGMAARRSLTVGERVGLVLLGFALGCTALVFGLTAWVHAAKVACHGRYECPF
jgi:hypothetical protein